MRYLAVLVLLTLSTRAFLLGNVGEKGANMCLGCTFVVAVVEQLAQVHNETVDASMDRLCKYLPNPMQPPCRDLIMKYGGAVIELLENRETPDRVCQVIDLCSAPFHQCRLFPPPATADEIPLEELKQRVEIKTGSSLKETPWEWIIQKISNVFNNHKPLEDLDSDLFGGGDEFELRGTAWRGKDCNDHNKLIYPGRNDTTYPASVDHNCNGILGSDNNGVSYEDKFCKGTKYMGIAILGDSVGAHFAAPTTWITAASINESTYQNMVEILENELDWPQLSATTGYMNSTWQGRPLGPVWSLYLKFRERNRCVHRDFQNIAVNGARTSAMARDIMYSLHRNATDQPIFISYALVGNDVCNGHPGMEAMTTPAEFRVNVMNALTYLDKWVPRGSHVAFTGLIDGRIIWNTLNARYHPIGQLNSDVTFSTYWTWLNCLQSNPCLGWMNTNETLRNMTTMRANALNDVYEDIVSSETFNNFDIHYFPNPMAPLMQQWVAGGGQPWQLFEEMIGMHPNQMANYLVAQYYSQQLEEQFPQFLPGINPFNAQIEALFGDQGGY